MRACQRTWVAFAIASSMTLVACQQLVGIEALPGASTDAGRDTAPTCVPLASDNATCSECMRTTCCAEIDACDRDVSCASGRRCLSACAPGDEPCRAACNVRLTGALNPLLQCTAQHCATQCGTACGGIVGIAFGAVLNPRVLPDCGACLGRLSCDVYETCASRVDCLDAVGCIAACSPLDRSCNNACVANAEVLGIYQEASSRYRQCSPECALGRDYRCLDHVTWPSPLSSDAIELIVPVVEPDGTHAIEGADVRACAELPVETCSDVATAVKTDAAGLARIRVPVATTVFGGFRGRLEISKKGYITVLRIPGPPPAGSQKINSTPLVPVEIYPLLAAQVAADPSGGAAIALAFDCNWSPASKVTLAIDAPGVVPFYLVSSSEFSRTGPTTSTGFGGFFQIPDGNWTVTSHVTVDGKDVIMGRRRLPIRAGTLTDVDLAPSP
jgi:hypothetical protein